MIDRQGGEREGRWMNTRLLAGGTLSLTLAAIAAAACAETSAAAPPGPGDDQTASEAGSLLSQADDWSGYAHVGYRLDPHWRMDLQGGYRGGAGPASNA